MTGRPLAQRQQGIGGRLGGLLPAVLLLTALTSVLLPARPAAAHPLDVYLQASYLTLAPTEVTVEVDLSPGVLVAPWVLEQLDRNGDAQVSDAEARSYLQQVVGVAQVRVDDQPLPMTLTRVEVPPYLTIQAGYGTLKVWATAAPGGAAAADGEHRVFFRNGLVDQQARYQVNAFVAQGAQVALGTQQRDPTQQQAIVTYRVGSAVGSGATAAVRDQARAAAGSARLAGYLQDPSLSAWAVLLALGAAALLGALHALTPGHAKTLMAAYLVGSGGTVRDAATLGAVVTFTHTASVVIIGLVALLASQFLVPGVLVPLLEALSGLLVVALGVRLLRLRWPRRAPAAPAELIELAPAGTVHSHADHDRALLDQVHSHGGHEHSHALPAGGVSTRSLAAMGVSGGLVPCPEALGVMVLAVGVNRTVLGLALVMAFSLGLAAVLIALGVLLVRSRTLLTRLDRLPAVWTSVLPLVSAGIVTALGAALVLRATGSDLLPSL